MKKKIPPPTPSVDFGLRQLEVFTKVVELSSFSKASDAVFLAQASVSERISNLENMVGTKLLDRLGRRVVPTKAGELLYKHAVKLLERKRSACLAMQEFLGMKQGAIHLGGSTIPGEYIFPKIIGQFREKYPLISVKLTISDTSEIEGQVLAGNLELGVVGSKNTNKSLTHHELWKDELVLAVPIQHPWAHKREVLPEELSDELFILREMGSGTLKIMEDYLRSSGLKGLDSFRIAARFGTSTAVKEGIKAGLGISILSSRALHTELEAGMIKALKIRGLPMSRIFYLVKDKRRAISPPCRVMFDFLLTTKDCPKKK